MTILEILTDKTFRSDLNYGNKMGKKGGFYNITWSSQFRDATSRAGTESGN